MAPSIIIAVRAVIQLGNIPLDVFQLPDGEYRLSLTQVLEAIDAPKNWISRLLYNAPNALKELQGGGFRGYSETVKVKNEAKARQAKTLTISDASLVWRYFAKRGNDVALDLLTAGSAESIERRADNAFNVVRTEEERNARYKARVAGMATRRELTDAIKEYAARHPELSEDRRRWLYSNASEMLNLALFGKKSKALKIDRGCPESGLLRDYLEERELNNVNVVEAVSMRLIDQQDVEPVAAVKSALQRACFVS